MFLRIFIKSCLGVERKGEIFKSHLNGGNGERNFVVAKLSRISVVLMCIRKIQGENICSIFQIHFLAPLFVAKGIGILRCHLIYRNNKVLVGQKFNKSHF